MTEDDGVQLTSMAHPIAPWWVRIRHWFFPPRIHESALEDFDMNVYHGFCQGGPLAGKPLTLMDRKLFQVPEQKGFYRYVEASGPTPSQWVWIEKKPGEPNG